MVPVQTFLKYVEEIYRSKPAYKLGHDGSDGLCDCIGLCRGAIKRAGGTAKGLSGTNAAARYTIKNFKSIGSVKNLQLGDVVLKGRPYDPNDEYPLPSKYLQGGSAYNGDTTNYVHIGVVTKLNPLEITHMTSPTAKKDTKLGKWNYYGQLPQIDYQSKKGADTMQATVYSANGGAVNMRSKPSTSATIVAKVPNKATVEVSSTSQEWSLISYNGKQGYMMSSFLRFDGQDSADKDMVTISRAELTALYTKLESVYKAIGNLLKE